MILPGIIVLLFSDVIQCSPCCGLRVSMVVKASGLWF